MGHRILVTGASQGLGRGFALGLVEAGATVVGFARSETGLAETRKLSEGLIGTFEGRTVDLSGDTEPVVDSVWMDGPISGVIHAAGVQVRKPALDIARDDWKRVTSIQAEAPFFLSQAVARRQRQVGIRGAHLFIGSLTSWIGRPNVVPYAAAKSAILGLTRSLAVEWAPYGLRVNAICPGYFHTALNDAVLADPNERERILARIPMKRLGIADDLVGAAIFLLSDASAYVTGQVINVDGGWLAG